MTAGEQKAAKARTRATRTVLPPGGLLSSRVPPEFPGHNKSLLLPEVLLKLRAPAALPDAGTRRASGPRVSSSPPRRRPGVETDVAEVVARVGEEPQCRQGSLGDGRQLLLHLVPDIVGTRVVVDRQEQLRRECLDVFVHDAAGRHRDRRELDVGPGQPCECFGNPGALRDPVVSCQASAKLPTRNCHIMLTVPLVRARQDGGAVPSGGYCAHIR